MRVVVKFHRTVEPALEEWWRAICQAHHGNADLARLARDELVRQLQDAKGLPHGAEFLRTHVPPCWGWRFTANTWVLYQYRDRHLGFWHGIERTVVVIGVRNQPPA